MHLFKPTVMKEKLTDITPELLREMGVSCILLDVDNTLAAYESRDPIPQAVPWTKELQKAGFRMMIVSNNYPRRVAPFAGKFGLEYVTFACKPLPFGYLKARRFFGEAASACTIVGDQIFTDVVGANLCGMKSILVEPIKYETTFLFRVRRDAEQKLKRRY